MKIVKPVRCLPTNLLSPYKTSDLCVNGPKRVFFLAEQNVLFGLKENLLPLSYLLFGQKISLLPLQKVLFGLKENLLPVSHLLFGQKISLLPLSYLSFGLKIFLFGDSSKISCQNGTCESN